MLATLVALLLWLLNIKLARAARWRSYREIRQDVERHWRRLKSELYGTASLSNAELNHGTEAFDRRLFRARW